MMEKYTYLESVLLQRLGNIMSIADNEIEFVRALKKADINFPRPNNYKYKPWTCPKHIYITIYSDEKAWEIIRCPYCGNEKLKHF